MNTIEEGQVLHRFGKRLEEMTCSRHCVDVEVDVAEENHRALSGVLLLPAREHTGLHEAFKNLNRIAIG